MSVISGVSTQALQYTPPKAPPAPAAAPVVQTSTPAAGNDTDGDSDGSTGSKINTYA